LAAGTFCQPSSGRSASGALDLLADFWTGKSWKVLIYPSWPGGGHCMKKSRFSEQQIAFVLRQAEEGTPVAEVCRKAGISEASFYNWRKKYGGLMPSEMKRLKKLVTDLSLDKATLQDVIRRKISGLPGSGRWSTRLGQFGR
jgi:putative transposase